MHYLTELSIENKRQYCAQHGFELVVAQNLGHGRTEPRAKACRPHTEDGDSQISRDVAAARWVECERLSTGLRVRPTDGLMAVDGGAAGICPHLLLCSVFSSKTMIKALVSSHDSEPVSVVTTNNPPPHPPVGAMAMLHC